MRKQCVPGASPFFARAGDEATDGAAWSHWLHSPRLWVLATNQYDILHRRSPWYSKIFLVKRPLSALLMLFASLTSQTFSVPQHRSLSVPHILKAIGAVERKGSGCKTSFLHTCYIQ